MQALAFAGRRDVRGQPLPDDGVRFLGPWVHGPATSRFLYLTVLATRDQPRVSRRVKVPLRSIRWSTNDSPGAQGGLEVTVDRPRAGMARLLGEG